MSTLERFYVVVAHRSGQPVCLACHTNPDCRRINCETCGAPLDTEPECPFDQPEISAPWAGDYAAMARGEMTHLQHQVSVARWALHHAETRSPKVLAKWTPLAEAHRGVVVPIFPEGYDHPSHDE